MLALLSLLDLVYMLRSTLAATLLKIIALPVPLLRQVPLDPLKQRKTVGFLRFFEDGADKSIKRCPKSSKDRFWTILGTLWGPLGHPKKQPKKHLKKKHPKRP